MMQIAVFTFNPFGENTYIIYDETREAVIVDPGNYGKDEDNRLESFIESEQLVPKWIANTHAHVDHVLGVSFAKRRWGIPFVLHRTEEPILRSVKVYAPHYGFVHYQEPEVDQWFEEGDEITFGETTLEILFVPGHAPGHVAFYHAPSKTLIAGDVLFRESIGRTDLPGGDHPTLLRSIREKIFVLPEEVTVYPGHGPSTTVGHEKKYNPFF